MWKLKIIVIKAMHCIMECFSYKSHSLEKKVQWKSEQGSMLIHTTLSKLIYFWIYGKHLNLRTGNRANEQREGKEVIRTAREYGVVSMSQTTRKMDPMKIMGLSEHC